MVRVLLTCLLLFASGCPDDGAGSGSAGAGAGPDGLEPGDDGANGIMMAQPDPTGPAPEPPQMEDGDGRRDDDGNDMAMASGGDAETSGEAAEPGATPGDGVGTDPGAADAPASPTGAVADCDLSRTRVHLDGGMVAEGTFCDDVVVCAADADGAAALTTAAPGFDCDTGENVIGLCGDDELPCVWRPGELDADEAQQVCAATTVLPPDGELVCVVYR